MPSHFFILGLPRSRTAWLANFFTYGEAFCYHEALNGVDSFDAYRAKLDLPHQFVGDADTGLVLFDFKKHFPAAKVIIIDSGVDRAVEYGAKHYGVDQTKELQLMQNKLNATEGLHVALDDINGQLPAMWTYITGGTVNKLRAESLKDLVVQVKEPYKFDYDAVSRLVLSESI